MHYAVSHGNFDVVSILLDSKVCDINIINDAGYTCVMLVSLAQIKSDTHRDVIRRLFSMADVNLKAKQVITDELLSCNGTGRSRNILLHNCLKKTKENLFQLEYS